MNNQTREHWIRAEADRLARELAPLGYTADECLRLAMLMHDMDVDNKTAADLTPEQVILQELIAMQGFDTATAGLLARTLTKLDWRRLELSSQFTADFLDVSRNTLLTNMVRGSVPAKVVILNRAGDRQDTITYWLSRVLVTRAWRRKHPRSGGPVSGFPPADYNAARIAMERRVVPPRTGAEGGG